MDVIYRASEHWAVVENWQTSADFDEVRAAGQFLVIPEIYLFRILPLVKKPVDAYKIPACAGMTGDFVMLMLTEMISAMASAPQRYPLWPVLLNDIRYGQCSLTIAQDTRVSCAEPMSGGYSYQAAARSHCRTASGSTLIVSYAVPDTLWPTR